MDKEILYQEGLKIALQKGYTGDFALGFAEGYVIGFEKGYAIGIEEGRLQVKNEIAARLKEMGYDEEFISRSTGLTIEEI
ncbi:FliH/SctL family protein [Bacteroides caecigallinarum]|uniref:hypothetical protein n=1 Tax=Bacteroides caecigallinarum TaxID=1411144 RepID=UPI001F2E8539|nr:hypothetical protein [Bacteroides caecigallinarum]MCF2552916.1 hypothetical protein [Bacteroides caecigallinarum]